VEHIQFVNTVNNVDTVTGSSIGLVKCYIFNNTLRKYGLETEQSTD